MYVVDIICFNLIVIIFVISLLGFLWESTIKDIKRVIGMRRAVRRMLRICSIRIFQILNKIAQTWLE